MAPIRPYGEDPAAGESRCRSEQRAREQPAYDDTRRRRGARRGPSRLPT